MMFSQLSLQRGTYRLRTKRPYHGRGVSASVYCLVRNFIDFPALVSSYLRSLCFLLVIFALTRFALTSNGAVQSVNIIDEQYGAGTGAFVLTSPAPNGPFPYGFIGIGGWRQSTTQENAANAVWPGGGISADTADVDLAIDVRTQPQMTYTLAFEAASASSEVTDTFRNELLFDVLLNDKVVFSIKLPFPGHGMTSPRSSYSKAFLADSSTTRLTFRMHPTPFYPDLRLYNVRINRPVNQPPTVAITVPEPQSKHAAGTNVLLAAVTADPDGAIASLNFYANGKLLGAGTNNQFTWTNVPAGAYSLTAVAQDNGGTSVTSAPVAIIVEAPPDCTVDAAPVLFDLSKWTMVQYEFFDQEDANWSVDPSKTLVTQTVNSDASILLSTNEVLNQRIEGVFRVGSTSDDDYIGFVFCFRDDRHFYLFDWKGSDQNDPAYGFAERGMSVKAITASTAIDGKSDLWPTAPVTSKAKVLYHNTIPWSQNVDYQFTLEFVPGRISIVVRQNTTVLASILVSDSTYSFGRFGFYNYSQDQVQYRGFKFQPVFVPPSVSLTKPVVNAEFRSPLQLSLEAEASACGVPVQLVEFFANGTKIGASETAPFTTVWTNPPLGVYSLVARAVDGRGIPSASIPVNISIIALKTNLPPSVLITSPVSGSRYLSGTNISLKATANDPDGTIARLNFYANQQFLGTGTNDQVIWTNVPVGNYTLIAIATDDKGLMATSAPVNIFVEAAKIPPTVEISQPVNGAIFLENTGITIEALATDPDGSVARVEFFNLTTNKLGEALTGPYRLIRSNLSAGAYSLTALAQDNSGLTSTSAPVTIQIQSLPAILVVSTSFPEGNDGSRGISIPLRLSRSSIGQVSLHYETIAGTASAPSDFASASGIIVFLPGETNKLIEISIVGDRVHEPDERFQIGFSDVTNAIGPSSPIDVSILNDDAMPELKVGNITVTEGDQGTTDAVFQVSLAGASSSSVSVSYETRDGTALAGTDYLAQSGVLVFDVVTNTAIAAASFSASQTPVLQISDSPAGILLTWTNRAQNVQLQETSSLGQGEPWLLSTNQPVTAGTVSSTRIAGSGKQRFYRLVVGSTLGSAVKEIRVPIIGDKIVEDTENFFLILSGNVNATINSAQSQATIIDNDQPFLSIDDISVTEGNVGTVDALFSVTLSSPSPRPVTVSFSTLDGTAKAGTDYDSTSGVISLNPGETKQNITVKVHGDILFESSEGFALQLSAPTNAVIAKASGLCTIVNDDTLLALSIDSATVAEGSGGTTPISLTVHLSAPALQPVTVNYTTADGTAQAGADYLSQNGTLTFAPGETLKTISLSIVADAEVEPAESFLVNLSNPVNATISGSQAGITIRDDDGQVAPPQVAITNPENDDTLPLGSPIIITATVTPGTSPIDKIQFFANGQSLGVASYSSQVVVSWNNSSQGTYNLTAVAYDSAGRTGQSAPVRIQVVPNDGKRRVAIIQNFADAEISKLQAWLKDMDLSSRVFNQEGLTYDLLSSFDLVIWDDLGTTNNGLSASDLAVFNQVYAAGKPLYFIGSKLVESGAGLPAASQTSWNRLLHLTSGGTPAADTRITIRDERDAINNGPFGLVGEFKAVGLETAVAPGGGEQVVARTSQTDAVISSEDASGVRIITQDVLAYHGSGLNAAVQREKLFKNSVWWLLRLPPPPPFLNLGVNVALEPQDPAVGQTFTVTASAHHNGEAEATGVTLTMVLPPNVSFISATSEAGECVYEDGVVICFLGKLSQSAIASASIVLRWNTGPSASIFTSVSPNQPEARTDDNAVTIFLGKTP